MPIPVTCPSCNHSLKAPDKAAGRKAKCPKCGGVVTIPGGVPAKSASAAPAKVKQQAPAVAAEPTLPSRATEVLPQVQQPRPLAVDLRVQHELAPAAPAPPPTPAPAEQTGACAFCGEQVLAVAKKCKHCGEVLDPALRAAMTPAPALQAAPAQQPTINITNVNTAVANAGGRKRWSPIVAFFLSLLIPGLGQLYKGQVINALVWFVVVAIGYVAFIIPGLILHFCCAIGAAMGDPYR